MNLKDYNWFKIEAICKYFEKVNNITKLINLIDIVNNEKLELFILGDGSNILLNEAMNNFMVIKPDFKEIKNIYIDNIQYISVGAGVLLDDFVKYCINLNFLNMEYFSGIPGTIGGCTFMNVHYKNFFLSDFFTMITVFDIKEKKIKNFKKEELNYTYMNNIIKESNNFIILTVVFKLIKNIDQNNNQFKRREEFLLYRSSRYPSSNTCGCFFYNIKHLNGKEKSMGYQIEKLNILENYDFKNVRIHDTHNNMFVTNNNCTSTEILELADFIKKKIKNNLNFIPKIECRLIGFD